MAFTTGDNNFGTAKWIVDATAGQGTHTTIASALTAASSGQTIFIRPGTYTENLTLKAGVNLAAYQGDSYTPNVTIVGKATMTTAGTVTISGIYLKTNADFFLAVTGSAASVVNLVDCFLDCHDNTGISYTSSSSSSSIDVEFCNYLLGSNVLTLFAGTGAGSLSFMSVESTGPVSSSSTASTMTAGSLNVNASTMVFPITTSGTANIELAYSAFSLGAVNTTCLTVNGTGNASDSYSCFYLAGTASAISVGAGATLNLHGDNSVNSSNTNAITGAGTLSYAVIDYIGLSSKINTTTIQNSKTSIPSISSSDGSSAISISSSGAITEPSQPAFFAYLATTATNKTGNGTSYTLGTDALTEVYDQVSNFNTNGTFTAPVTGIYDLRAQITVTGTTVATSFVISIVVAGTSARTYTNTFTRTAGSTDQSVAVSALAKMTATDTATVTIVASGEAADTDDIKGGATAESYFCGQLSC